MNTQKWRARSEVCNFVRAMKYMTYLQAGLFKSSPKHLQNGYNISSEKARTDMKEIVANKKDWR